MQLRSWTALIGANVISYYVATEYITPALSLHLAKTSAVNASGTIASVFWIMLSTIFTYIHKDIITFANIREHIVLVIWPSIFLFIWHISHMHVSFTTLHGIYTIASAAGAHFMIAAPICMAALYYTPSQIHTALLGSIWMIQTCVITIYQA